MLLDWHVALWLNIWLLDQTWWRCIVPPSLRLLLPLIWKTSKNKYTRFHSYRSQFVDLNLLLFFFLQYFVFLWQGKNQRQLTTSSLRPHTHTDSSGIHIGRELQPFMPSALNLRVLLPHLCPDNQLSCLLHGILLALFSHLGHSTSPPSPSLLILQPFTANNQMFSDRTAFRKSNTPALLRQGTPRPVLLLESHDCCLILQLCQCITLLHVDDFKTDKRGYALPISKAVHVYFFEFPLFVKGFK